MIGASSSGPALLLVEFGARLAAAERADYLARLGAALATGRPFAMVIDGRAVMPASQPDDRGCDPWFRERETKLQTLLRGVAFVTGPGLAAARVRTLSSLLPPGIGYAFFAGREEALHWAQTRAEGLPAAQRERHATRPMSVL